jgi:hypothetical protein
MIKEPQRPIIEDSINIGGYTHMKIKIRTAFDGRDFTVCQNIGTSRVLVSRAFLTYFVNVNIIKVSKSVKIAGYLGLVTKLRE